MEDFFLEIGEKRFRAPQVLKWIYHEGLTEFSGMTNLGKALRERLDGIAEIRLPEIALENYLMRMAKRTCSRSASRRQRHWFSFGK